MAMTQKTLLSIAQQITGELGFPQPSAVITSTDTKVLKVLAFVRAACDDLTYEYDWNFLQQRYTFDTVSGQEAYDWPSDYVRCLNGTFFDATNRWPLKIMTPTQWEILNIWNLTASPFERLRVYNGKMNFFPAPANTYTFVFDYISANHVIDGNTGAPKADFTQDSDICMFDSRLITYAAKYKFYASVGNDTTAVLADYQRVLSLAKGQDAPTPRLSLLPRPVHLIDNSNLPDGSWNTAP
jgi:hypothetical protein